MIDGNIFNLKDGEVVIGFKEGKKELFKDYILPIGLVETPVKFKRKEDGLELIKFVPNDGGLESMLALAATLMRSGELLSTIEACYWLDAGNTEDVYAGVIETRKEQ